MGTLQIIWDMYKQDIAGYAIALATVFSPVIYMSIVNQVTYHHLSAPSKQEIQEIKEEYDNMGEEEKKCHLVDLVREQ